MAQKKAYSRYFIILQQDETGYSLASDKLPSGYTKIETKNDKCKISYYVQNLKKEKEPYYMVLICNKRDSKKLINIGMMNIDDYGRADITYEYRIDDVAGTNISVDMITGAAVIKFIDSNMIPVMSGFSTTDIPADWKTYSIIETSRNAENIIQDVPQSAPEDASENSEADEKTRVEHKEEKNIFDEYENKIEEVKLADIKDERNEEIASQENPEEIQDSNNEGERNEEDDESRIDNNSNENMDSSSSKTEEFINYENLKYNGDNSYRRDEDKKDKSDYPCGTVGDFFKALAEDLEEVEDVCKEIKKCKWYKVPVKSLDELCNETNYNKYTTIYYPMISYYPYIRRYGYYLLGYKYDDTGKMKYIVYGIPGKKCRVEQPYGGKSGFVTWVPVKLGEEKDGDMGHWLMFYDFRTSTIVIPVRK